MRCPQACLGAEIAGGVHIAKVDAEATGVDERVVEGSALNKAAEARAGDLLQAVVGFLVADVDAERLAGRRIAHDAVAKAGLAVGKVHFTLVAEATGNGAFATKANAPRAGIEAHVAGDDGIVRVGNEADVILNTSANLEAPSGFLVLKLRSALPYGRDLGLGRLDLGDRFLQRLYLGLEQITSSRFSSFIERAAFDDAFINTRRLGINLGYVNAAGDFRAKAGLWAAHSIDASLDNDGWIGAARLVYSPLMDGNQLHFGLNYQHREFQSNNGATASSSTGAPSTNQLARYRARPYTQLTDQRFVDTGNFAAKSDDIIGIEAAGIFKSFHVAGEAQFTKANAYDAGDTVTFNAASDDPVDSLDPFNGNQFVSDGNPSFWGGYIEAGYFLTGETRGYKNGLWDRTKVLKPFSQGGWGAFQVIGRVDYLDLASNKLKSGCTNNFLTGVCTAPSQATLLGKGGTQLGFLAGLTWIPEDYFRILLNYSHASIEGGPLAAQIESDSTKPIDERKYGNDTVQMRFQIDF